MDTLVRNTTLRFSRRGADGYEPLNQASEHVWRRRDSDHGDQRTFSRPRSTHKQQHSNSPVMMNSYSHRRNRARQRQIFLQTYKLGSMDSSGKSRARNLKKFVVNVKTVAVSVLSFMRVDTLKPCNSGSAICASSPSRIAKFC